MTDDKTNKPASLRDEESTVAEEETAIIQLTKAEFAICICCLILALFLGALDQSIYAVAIPAIAAQFNSLELMNWIATAYCLTTAAFMPLYAQLSNIYGRKPIFLLSLLLFELGSGLCGASVNMTMLIIARAIAGAGASGIFGLVDIIVADITSIRNRGLVYSLMTAVWTVSATAGPFLGGIFVDYLSWRWIFYINLPLGLVIIPLVYFYLNLPSPPQESLFVSLKKIDWLGTVLVIGAITSFLLAIQGGGTMFPWASAAFVVLIMASVVATVAFIYVEGFVAKNPVLPLSCFTNRNSVGTFICAFFIGASLVLNIYAPALFQIVFGDSSMVSGLKSVPSAIGSLVSQFICAAITSKTGLIFPFIPTGAVILSAGFALLGLLDQYSALWQQIVYLFIAGIPAGMLFNSNLVIAQSGLSGDVLAIAISTMSLFQVLGSTVAPAIAGAVFNDQIVKNLATVEVPADFSKSKLYSDPSLIRNATFMEQGSSLQTAAINAYSKSISTVFLMSIAFGVGLFVASVLLNKSRLPKEEEAVVLDLEEVSTETRESSKKPTPISEFVVAA
ncbi:UNVERIFIED_CONTAM: hypothetical protein HDU68_010022 [Siphonaria sp. JEL0065]|nr:hypothetical protein HDU68_010022 [Siphonaria sp. JEL0065]